MKLTYRATIIVDMYYPEEYGASEPTIENTVKLINSGKAEAELVSNLFMEPVIIIKQK